MIVSIRKEYPGHAQKVMHALWGLGLMMLVKTIIVVDHYVDVQDLSEVAWRVTCNINPATEHYLQRRPDRRPRPRDADPKVREQDGD